MTTYLFIYSGSAFLAVIITPIVIKFAHVIKAVDRPGVRTVHTKPVPRIGGVAIFISTISLFIAALFLNNSIGQAFSKLKTQLIVLLCSAALIFQIGLIDDLKGLKARLKLCVELITACALCFFGVRITSIAFTEHWTIHLGLFSYPLSVLWIVGITNAMNLSDGLDGLAAGISAIACGVITIFAIHSGNIPMTVLMLSLLGSLTGFLFFNFNPAKIFLGDCGSLFLGFMIASSSILCSMKSSALVGLALPVLALGIPIFDTFFSILRRFLERRSIFSPDRRHFHHRLIDMGLKQHHVVITIYILTLLIAGLGMFMMITHDINSIVILLCIIVLLVLLFRLVGSVRLKETISGLQKKYQLASQRKQEKMNFEDAQLHFKNAGSYDQWWSAICKAASGLDFAWVSLKTKNGDGTIQNEIWRMPDLEPDLSRLVVMTIPLAGNGDNKSYEFEIAVLINSSYESAGHRVTLFNRLIDEHYRSDFVNNRFFCTSIAIE